MKQLIGIVLLGGLVSGCKNSCQDLCQDMASYLEDECGITVSASDIDACVTEQADADAIDRKACRQYDGANQIEEQWGCEELEGYFSTAE